VRRQNHDSKLQKIGASKTAEKANYGQLQTNEIAQTKQILQKTQEIILAVENDWAFPKRQIWPKSGLRRREKIPSSINFIKIFGCGIGASEKDHFCLKAECQKWKRAKTERNKWWCAR
jgi:hypothetical protein